MNDTLVTYGGSVKALGSGRIAGYLVSYSTEDAPDRADEFFDAKTDFVAEFPATSPVYYHHGLDKTVGKQRLGRGEMKQDDLGVWVEAQLDLRNAYARAVYKLAEEGALGWSSGTASHLVEREPAGKAYRITHWPLGLDASLTPTPCQPHGTEALPLKAWLEQAPELPDLQVEEAEPVKATLDTSSSHLTQYDRVDGAIHDHHAALTDMVSSVKSGALPADQAHDAVRAATSTLMDGCKKPAAKADDAQDAPPAADPPSPSFCLPAEQTFADHAETVLAAVGALVHRGRDIQALRIKAGRKLSAASLDRLGAIRDQLQQAHTDLHGFLTEPAPPVEEVDAEAAKTDDAPASHPSLLSEFSTFMTTCARLNGVRVGGS